MSPIVRRCAAAVLAILGASSGAWGAPDQRGTPPPATPASPQQQPQVFRSTINLVPVDVRVVDRNGRPVTDLKESDFAVLENNVRQQIRHFSSMSLQPETTVTPQPLFRAE